MLRHSLCLLAVASAIAQPVYAADSCARRLVAALPITVSGMRPLIAGTINGQPVNFVVDSTELSSVLSLESALKLGLKTHPRPVEITANNASGAERGGRTTVRELAIAGMEGRLPKGANFVVVAHKFTPEFVGLIGREMFGNADVEFDLAKGAIRLMY